MKTDQSAKYIESQAKEICKKTGAQAVVIINVKDMVINHYGYGITKKFHKVADIMAWVCMKAIAENVEKEIPVTKATCQVI